MLFADCLWLGDLISVPRIIWPVLDVARALRSGCNWPGRDWSTQVEESSSLTIYHMHCDRCRKINFEARTFSGLLLARSGTPDRLLASSFRTGSLDPTELGTELNLWWVPTE